MNVCKRVHYSGRVQGVGFRYTAQSLAESLAVRGYVRNLANGDVELVAEGEPAKVQAFLDAVGRQMGRHIHGTRIENTQPSGETAFQVRY